MLNLSRNIARGKSYLAISKGSIDRRRRAAENILSKIYNAEILCEDPLIIRFRVGSDEKAREAVQSFGEDILVLRGGVGLARSLCSFGREGTRGRISSFFTNNTGSRGPGVFLEIARMVSLVAPSVVSTLGRFINDMNMIIAGSIASGGVLIMNIYNSRKNSSARIEERVGDR